MCLVATVWDSAGREKPKVSCKVEETIILLLNLLVNLLAKYGHPPPIILVSKEVLRVLCR